MSYEKKGPLGIIITGYGFAGHEPRVARRGYFYGLGAETLLSAAQSRTLEPTTPSTALLYRTDTTSAPTEYEVDVARAREIQKLSRETRALAPTDPVAEASRNLQVLDRATAAEQTAQREVSVQSYPEPLPSPGSAEWQPYVTDVRRLALQRLYAGNLQHPTSDSQKEWLAFETALAWKAGTTPPLPAVGPAPTDAVATTASPAATSPAAGASTPAAAAAAAATSAAAPASAAAPVLLGGAALALFLLLR